MGERLIRVDCAMWSDLRAYNEAIVAVGPSGGVVVCSCSLLATDSNLDWTSASSLACSELKICRVYAIKRPQGFTQESLVSKQRGGTRTHARHSHAPLRHLNDGW